MPALPTVLLVEDDPTNQLIALSMLRHLGIEADAAPNGQVGVSKAVENAYDVVLMDIQMPVMDGVEAMRSIRALLPPGRCPRIVAVTAHAVSGTRDRLLAAGFDGFYNKPLSITLLEEAISAPAAPSAEPAAEPALVVRAAPAPVGEAREALHARVRAHVRAILGEDDDAFAADLLASFSSSSREAVREAEAAWQQGEASAVASAAHKLKGSAANIGLEGLREIWDAVESGVRQGGSAEALAGPLAEAFERTEQTLALLGE